MNRFLTLSVSFFVLSVSTFSFAQRRDDPRDRDRQERREDRQDRREERREDRQERREDRQERERLERERAERDRLERDRRDREERDRRDRNRGPGRNRPSGSFQDYPGATAPNNYCTDCAFENRTDTPRSGKRNAPDRFLVNNDRDSIDARCRELGWDYGQALQWYSYEEWCRYGNARTRTWDRYSRRWIFGRCENGNVKMARCFAR